VTNTPGLTLAASTVDGCRPRSDVGALLLSRYYEAVRAAGRLTLSRERSLLYELCRVVEETDFPFLTIAALHATADAPNLRPGARGRRGMLARRLLALFQASGELPSPKEMQSLNAIARQLAAAPEPGRRFLHAWESLRAERVGAYERRHELRRLRELEEVLAAYPAARTEFVIDEWFRRLVRRVVACQCHPVTRARDADRCFSCGAHAADVGTRPSPGNDKQRELRSLAHRYLRFRLDFELTAVA